MNGNRFIYSGAAALLVGINLCLGGLWARAEPSATVGISSPFTYGTSSVAIRPGDWVGLGAQIIRGNDANPPTRLSVWDTAGHSFSVTALPNQSWVGGTTYLNTNATSVSGSGKFTTYHQGDYAEVYVSVRPRADLIAAAPALEADGSVSYGYRNGGATWDPWGHRVLVELWYARGATLLVKIADHVLKTGAGASESFNIPANQIPAPPANTDGLVTVVDGINGLVAAGGVIPETNEGNNLARTPLPDLKVVTPVYLPSGGLQFGYQVTGSSATTDQYVELQLFYATSPNPADIIRDVPRLYGCTLDLTPGPVTTVRLDPGDFALPPSNARYVIAEIDAANAVRESSESDNVAAIPCQVAPGFTPLSSAPGVGVYRNDQGMYATMVDLTRATIGQIGVRNSYHPLNLWWQAGQAYNTSTRSLTAMVNGTEFGPDVTSHIPGTDLSFPDALKVVGGVWDYGSSAQDPSQERVLFSYDGATAAILPYSKELMDDVRYPNLIGSISGVRRTRASTELRRQWVGLRDFVASGPRGEARARTAIFLTMPEGNTNWYKADGTMESFGVADTNRAQLDGGGSTTLMVGGRQLATPVTGRLLPQVIIIFSGK